MNDLSEGNLKTLRANGFKDHHIQSLMKILKTRQQVHSEQDPFNYLDAYNALEQHERIQIDTIRQKERNIMKFLESHAYEMENNVTAFDWLKMYAKVLGNTDFNLLIEEHHR